MKPSRRILTLTLAGLILLATDGAWALSRPTHLTTATQQSQRIESTLATRIAIHRAQPDLSEPLQARRAPRQPRALWTWFSEALAPILLFEPALQLDALQRRASRRLPILLPGWASPLPVVGPLRMGRVLDGRRPSEPE